jgi:hypothetical protein
MSIFHTCQVPSVAAQYQISCGVTGLMHKDTTSNNQGLIIANASYGDPLPWLETDSVYHVYDFDFWFSLFRFNEPDALTELLVNNPGFPRRDQLLSINLRYAPVVAKHLKDNTFKHKDLKKPIFFVPKLKF